MIQKLLIGRPHIRLIMDELARHTPDEACGVLIGRRDSEKITVDRVIPIKNSRSSDRSFELDPKEHYEAWKLADREGMDIVGVYHTHPHSAARPSLWDQESMENYQSVWIIAGRGEIKGYEWDGGIKPVEIIETI